MCFNVCEHAIRDSSIEKLTLPMRKTDAQGKHREWMFLSIKNAIHCVASSQSWYICKAILTMFQRLLGWYCSNCTAKLVTELLKENQAKHRDWGDATQCILIPRAKVQIPWWSTPSWRESCRCCEGRCRPSPIRRLTNPRTSGTGFAMLCFGLDGWRDTISNFLWR